MDWDRALEDLTTVPDVIGEVVGWRSWYVYQTGNMVRLASLKSGHAKECIWSPGQWMVAQCNDGTGTCHVAKTMGLEGLAARTPVEACRCGYYAARDRAHLISLGYNRYQATTTTGLSTVGEHRVKGLRVIGEVGMSGKVIEATQGWRAEKVRPVSLEVPYECWKLVRPLEDTYGIPVKLSNTLEVR